MGQKSTGVTSPARGGTVSRYWRSASDMSAVDPQPPTPLPREARQKRRKRHSTCRTDKTQAHVSRYFRAEEPKGVDRRKAQWVPPQSPYGLIQEQVYDNPWRVLLCCILLNKTTSTVVRRVVWRLFEMCPTPEAAVSIDQKCIEDIIQPLGIHRRRAIDIQQFSVDYMTKDWKSPTELHGIGQYGADAYAIFCEGKWEQVAPEDKELKRYHEWLKTTAGMGSGHERDLPPVKAEPASPESPPSSSGKRYACGDLPAEDLLRKKRIQT